MSNVISVRIISPTFTNTRLNAVVSVRGLPGTPGPSFDRNYQAPDIDITSLTAIDHGDGYSFPASALLASVNLTSTNSTESITDIENQPLGVPVRYFPESGLVVTFVHGTGGTNPRISTGINVELNGNKNEWIEFTNINGTICQTNSGIYSN